MANSYYDHTTYPSTSSSLSSSAMRSELDLVEAGFDKLPTLTANGSKIIAVNSGASALEAITTTGTGSGVRNTSPTFVTPILGVATATSINGMTITTTTGTLTIANGQTLTVTTGGTLGTAAYGTLGTSANNVVQLDGSARLPAVDGSQLTNLPGATVSTVTAVNFFTSQF